MTNQEVGRRMFCQCFILSQQYRYTITSNKDKLKNVPVFCPQTITNKLGAFSYNQLWGAWYKIQKKYLR